MKLIAALIFILVPVAEIATFIEVGGLIGLWPTLACIVATAIAGVALLRQQGLSTLAQAQQAVDQGELPVEPIIHGLFLLVAGAFLLTPGFITDAVGFLLLVPPVRLAIARVLWGWIKQSRDVHIVVEGTAREVHPDEDAADHGPGDGRGPLIEGKAVREDDSPWRHGKNDDSKP